MSNEVKRKEDALEQVHHPSHYNMGNIEVIDAIEDWKLGFNLGNAVKYIARAGHKTDMTNIPTKDVKKAFWYIARELVSQYGVQQGELAQIVMTIQKHKG